MSSPTESVLIGIWGTSSSDVFAVGGDVIHYNGNSWSKVYTGGGYKNEVWGSSSSDVFVVGYGGVYHYDGNNWNWVNSGATSELFGVWGSSSSNIYAVGKAGTIIHYPAPNQPPDMPSSPSPSNNASRVSVSVDMRWVGGDPDGDAVTYDAYFGTSTPPPLVSSDQPATLYAPGTLNYNTKYYWKIVATDSRGASAEGPLWEFTTSSGPIPGTPSNPYPANGATNMSVNSGLDWSDCTDTDTYDVHFGATSSPPYYDTVSGSSYLLPTLEYGTTYYWKIVAKNNYDNNASGPVWSFTTESELNNPPNKPSNPSPSNHATGVSASASLGWVGGDPDGDSVTHDVYFGTSLTPSLVSSNQPATTYDPGSLNSASKYYWKIVARDADGATTSGPVWDFTTIPGPTGAVTVTPAAPLTTAPTPRTTSMPPPTRRPGEARVYLYGQITNVEVGDDIVLNLSAVNLITKPTMTVQLILQVPSGMSVTSAEFVKGGGGQYTSNYTVAPGDIKDIGVHIRANQPGNFNVSGDILYYFGGDKSTAEYRTETLPVTVREAPSLTQTPVGPGGGPSKFSWYWIIPVIIASLALAVGIARLVLRMRTGR